MLEQPGADSVPGSLASAGTTTLSMQLLLTDKSANTYVYGLTCVTSAGGLHFYVRRRFCPCVCTRMHISNADTAYQQLDGWLVTTCARLFPMLLFTEGVASALKCRTV